MPKVPAIVPITDLRHDSSEILKRLRNTREPVMRHLRGIRDTKLVLRTLRLMPKVWSETWNGL